MTKLNRTFFSILALLAFIPGANAAASEKLAKAARVETNYQELRDLHIFLRIPSESCLVPADLAPALGGGGEQKSQELLGAINKTKFSKADRDFLKKHAEKCLFDCSCQFLGSVLEHFPKSKEITELKKTVDDQASTMTDNTYRSCQRSHAVKCSDSSIQKIIEQAKDSQN